MLEVSVCSKRLGSKSYVGDDGKECRGVVRSWKSRVDGGNGDEEGSGDVGVLGDVGEGVS